MTDPIPVRGSPAKSERGKSSLHAGAGTASADGAVLVKVTLESRLALRAGAGERRSVSRHALRPII